ncbi:MAG: cobalt-precorrin-5B (C(1))-methyltransferase, partial [Vulcanococcus sp.]
MAETAFTLPVWLAAAAVAAVGQLLEQRFEPRPALRLRPEDPEDEPVPVPVEAAARLGVDRALGMARCEPGDGLDLTRGLPVWVEARWGDPTPRDGDAWLQLEPGEGVGIHAGSTEACLSAYARQLLHCNLRPRVPEGRTLVLRITLPGGRELAQRTSNAAFGVVDGLALIGTQEEVQRSADPDQLNRALAQLRQKAQDSAL